MTGTEGALALPGLAAASPDLDLMPPAALADPVARLRGLMRDRREESVRILSGWIGQKEEA